MGRTVSKHRTVKKATFDGRWPKQMGAVLHRSHGLVNIKVTATVSGESVTRQSSCIGLTDITHTKKVCANNQNIPREAVEKENRNLRKITQEYIALCQANTKLQTELRVAVNAHKRLSDDQQHKIDIETKINGQLCKEVEANVKEFIELCQVNTQLQTELRVAVNAHKKLSDDQQHKIDTETKINEVLCEEVEAKVELVVLFSKEFDDECNANIMLARDKLASGKVIKGLLSNKKSRDQIVDKLQSKIDKELEIKRELITDVESKMKKLKVRIFEFRVLLHSMDTI